MRQIPDNSLRFKVAKFCLVLGVWWVVIRIGLHRSSGTELILGLYSEKLFAALGLSVALAAGWTAMVCHRRFPNWLRAGFEHSRLLLFMFFILGLALGFLALFTLPFVRDAVLGLVAATILFLVITLMPSPAIYFSNLNRREARIGCAMVLASLLVGFVLLEVGLRLCLPLETCRGFLNTDHLSILRDQPTKFTSHPYLVYYPTPGYRSPDGLNRHNTLGYRGGREITVPKPAGRFRIVTLGGSTTYSTGVPDWRDSYPEKLQEILRSTFTLPQVEVINAGAEGYTTLESLINLQTRVLDLEPDLIRIYHGINDVHSRLVPPDLYRGDNTTRRKSWDETYFAQLIFQIPSKLFRLVGLKFGWLRLPELEVLVGRFSARYWPVWVQVAGTDPATILQQNPPVYVARNLRHMAITAKQNDVKFAIISFVVRDGLGPDRTRSNDPPDHYRVALRRQNQIGRDVSREFGGLAIDLAAFMPSDEHLWSEDGIHFTQQGNAVRARFIAEKLAENGMLPKRK